MTIQSRRGVAPLEHPVRHRTMLEMEMLTPLLERVPRDLGAVRLVVARPAVGERQVLQVGHLDTTWGLLGDSWSQRSSTRSADGGPHARMQLNVMSWPVAAFLAVEESRVPLAGDQLYLDLDLSHANLPVGTRLSFGDPAGQGGIIEVTEQPHTGCAKFIDRFGAEAMRFVNGRQGRAARLRGLNAAVVRSGEVRPGDRVSVQRPAA